MSRRDELTTTSYALLGLLALQDWSTYELAQQMRRSLRLWWPRAESRLYDEPKRLVRLGLATARDEGVGRRPRTVYAITERGRAAVEEWLAAPGGTFRLEFEAMLKVLFADQAGREELLGTIAAIRDAVEADRATGAGFYEEYLRTGGPFPDRLHLIVLATDLYERLLDAIAAWADDASRQVAAWPTTRDAPDPAPELRRRLAVQRSRDR